VAGGAPVLLLLKTPLQPPVPLAVANQAAKAAFTCACDCPKATVAFVGQVSTGAVGAGIVKLEEQVSGAEQLEV
jgi:hypothetical protein